jgi:hypothetical protein
MSQPNGTAEREEYIANLKQDIKDAEEVLEEAKKDSISAIEWEHKCANKVDLYKSNLEEYLNE